MKVTTVILSFLLIAAMFLSAAVAADEATPKADAAAKFEQPILITSAGLSADVKLVGMLAKRDKLDAEVLEQAQPSDLEGIKTLIMVPGFSSKGLGAAGVSQADETERVNGLIEAAQKQGVPIITVHIGGTARRGGQSDAFNKAAAEASKQMIVVAQGDEDQFFSKIADEKKIPIEIVEKIANVASPLGALFK